MEREDKAQLHDIGVVSWTYAKWLSSTSGKA